MRLGASLPGVDAEVDTFYFYLEVPRSIILKERLILTWRGNLGWAALKSKFQVAGYV